MRVQSCAGFCASAARSGPRCAARQQLTVSSGTERDLLRLFAAATQKRQRMEVIMPLVLLWVGIPVLLIGGGYFIIHTMH